MAKRAGFRAAHCRRRLYRWHGGGRRGIDDARIRWFDLLKAPHFGYANRNIALRQATGDLVAFIAHDDIWFPDHLELLSGQLERGAAEWAYSRPLWVSTDGFVVPIGVNLTNEDELEHFLTEANSIPAPCVMHRRSCLEDLWLLAGRRAGGGRLAVVEQASSRAAAAAARFLSDADVASLQGLLAKGPDGLRPGRSGTQSCSADGLVA